VVVLPANCRLVEGTGTSMALFEAAGREELKAECAMRFEQAKRRNQRLVPGVSILTHAYALPAKAIMHTIVPKWRENKPRVGRAYDGGYHWKLLLFGFLCRRAHCEKRT